MKEVPRDGKIKFGFLDKVGSFFDGVVSVISPEKAYRRVAFRRARQMWSASGGYRGAKKNRLRADWLSTDGSVDEESLNDLPALRARTRDLNRNDAHASGITNTIVVNDIGTGIRPQSRVDNSIMGLSDKTVRNFQQAAERAWEIWLHEASADNKLDFYEMQYLCDRQILEAGEFIAIPMMLDELGRHFNFALQVVEPDRLMTPTDKLRDKSIRSGVEIGDRGQPLAYWIRKTHPGDSILAKGPRTNNSSNFVRFPAKNNAGRPNVFHLFFTDRPGQSRGIPFFAPVLNYFKDLAEYMEAELVAARIAACFSIFVTKTDPSGAAGAQTSEINPAGQRIEEFEPGIVEYLQAGEDIRSFTPTRPGDTFDPFVFRILRAISASLNLPYELVAKDFSKTNFSSARAALLEARRYFKYRQNWLSRKLCQPSWEMVQEEAYLKDELPAVNFFENKRDFCRATWIASGWQWVDPKKEGEASALAIKNNISTLADEAASQGKDWEENLAQRVREKVRIKELETEHEIMLTEQDTAPLVAPNGDPAEDE